MTANEPDPAGSIIEELRASITADPDPNPPVTANYPVSIGNLGGRGLLKLYDAANGGTIADIQNAVDELQGSV